MRNWLFCLTVLFLFFCIQSCHKQKDLSPLSTSSTIDYFPLYKGKYFIYEVIDSRYDLFGRHDSLYQLKVAFQETFQDLEGKTSYKLFRFKKSNNNFEFTLDSIWYTKQPDNSQILIIENNVPYLKLSNPLYESKTWNGNLYNSYPGEKYKVFNLGKSWGNYSNTVSIEQKNESNLTFKNYRIEVYSKDVGLVYKESQAIIYSSNGSDFGKNIIIGGTTLKQTLISYGTE